MFAVIDLGSNSFHLLIADYIDGHFNVIDRHSEKVQLAEGLSKSGVIKAGAMERGLRCLQGFQQTLQNYPIEKLSTVATQALRQAGNAEEFVGLVRGIGIDIEIISGTREAALIYRGICDPLPDADFNRLIIDIGGASTEVALGCDLNIILAESTAIGCVSWRDQFFADNFDYQAQAPAAKQAALNAIKPVADQLTDLHWREVYASSGTAKMLANIAKANNIAEDLVTRDNLTAIEKLIEPFKNTDDFDIAGLKPERKDLLAPGICIMSGVMQTFGIEQFDFSPTALREGILHEITSYRVDYHLQD